MKRYRRWLLGAIVFFGALILSGCGAKADSAITLNEDGSGERLFTFTIEAADLQDHLNNDTSGIDGVFQSSTPEQLEYSGVSDGADGAKVFSFKMTFSSADDYRDKIAALVAAGGGEASEITLEIESSVFRQGLVFEDYSTNREIMQWAVTAVEDADVIADENDTLSSSDFTEEGETTITFGELEETSYGGFSINSVQDLGVDTVEVATSGIDTGEYTRVITLTMPRERYAINQEGFDEYFESVTPEGGTLTGPGETGSSWVIEFSSSDTGEIIEWTNAVLSSSQTEFAVSSGVADGEGQLARKLEIVDYFECSEVCQEYSQAEGSISLPEEWILDYGYPPSQEALVYTKPVQLASLSMDVAATATDPSIQIHYGFATADVEGLEDSIPGALSSNPDSIAASDGDGQKVFTQTLAAETPEALQSLLDEQLPGTHFSVQEHDASFFTKEISYTFALAVPQTQMTGEQPYTMTATFEDLGKFEPGKSSLPGSASMDDEVVTMEVGPYEFAEMTVVGTQTKFVNVAIVAGLVLLGVAGLAAFVVYLIRNNRDQGGAGAAVGQGTPMSGATPPPAGYASASQPMSQGTPPPAGYSSASYPTQQGTPIPPPQQPQGQQWGPVSGQTPPPPGNWNHQG